MNILPLTDFSRISYFWRAMNFRAAAFSILLIFIGASAFSQVTGPEQDCDDAIAVCQTVYVQNSSYQGTGSFQDLPDGTSCLENEENNSVWYIFTVTISGQLHFSIIPQAAVDYDFTLFNLTGKSCADIGSGALQVRCNYAFTNGATGIGYGGVGLDGVNAVEGPGGRAYCDTLDVLVGETYALLVDNFSATTFGYTLDFNPSGASTASIIDFLPPEITATDTLTCDATDSITVFFSEPVLCSSLDTLGTDFQVIGPSAVTVDTAYSTSCRNGSFTLSAVVIFSSSISTGGSYGLILKQGNDGGTVEDNCGNQAVRDTIPFTVPNQIFAAFDFTEASSCVADTFRFNSTSTGNINTYAWDFGDSGTSAVDDPVHIYADTGTYTATLIVSSAECSDTAVNSNIVVTNSYLADFTFSPVIPCVNEVVTFTDISSAVGTNYLWRFGDNQISGNQNTTHAYTAPGIYIVEFEIIDQVNVCNAIIRDTILVRPNATANFISNSPVCADAVVNFTDASAGSPASWQWTFPDGSVATSPSATFSFSAAGSFSVQLAVVDSFCGADTATQTLDVLPLPSFSLGLDTSICLSESVVLSASPGADSYLWSTGATTQTITFSAVPDTVWATATLNGCAYTDFIIVDERTLDCSFALVPSGFSPNDDGKNDLLRVLTKRVSEFEIIVFNRWGEEVYRATNRDLGGWDGTYKDEPLDIGVFAYVLTWLSLSGDKFVEHGSVTLVR